MQFILSGCLSLIFIISVQWPLPAFAESGFDQTFTLFKSGDSIGIISPTLLSERLRLGDNGLPEKFIAQAKLKLKTVEDNQSITLPVPIQSHLIDVTLQKGWSQQHGFLQWQANNREANGLAI